jgi:hypothetical protein
MIRIMNILQLNLLVIGKKWEVLKNKLIINFVLNLLKNIHNIFKDINKDKLNNYKQN